MISVIIHFAYLLSTGNDEIQLGSHLLKRAIYPGLVKTAFIALTKMTFTNRKSVDYNTPGVKTFTAKFTLFREV